MTATFAAAQAARPLPEIHISGRAVTVAAAIVAAAAAYLVAPALATAVALLVAPAVVLSAVAERAGAFEEPDLAIRMMGLENRLR